ncbi:MAG: ATP-binding protein [Anaerolineae bacterium]|nr:ATP-binding protein [Anaerolineae bacterium]
MPDIKPNHSQIGILGNNAHIEGGIHFHGASRPIPLQRPPRAEHFTGRQDELARLIADLQPGKVVTLCGPGGIGKSALAAEAIWTLAPGNQPPALFPDGVITHNFYNQPQAALALEAIARTYGEDPRPTPRDAAQRALAGRTALLLLDGTEMVDDLNAVLEIRGGCGVLITSLQRKQAVAARCDIAPLPVDEAVALLQAWGGARAADAAAAEQVCQLMGGLPLAVRLAGKYLAEQEENVAVYLRWLAQTPLAALDHGERRLDSVPVLMGRSVAQVSEGARRALSMVGALALPSIGREAAAAALDVSDVEAGRLLGELVSYGLLLRPDERYQVSHALVHTYARQHYPPDGETVQRLALYYTILAMKQTKKGSAGYVVMDVSSQ